MLNETLFLQDYEICKQEKEQIIANAEVAVNGIMTNEATKAKIKNILVDENSKEIDTKIAFYEKYIVKEV